MSLDRISNSQTTNFVPTDQPARNAAPVVSAETANLNTSRLGESSFAGQYLKNKLLNSGGNQPQTVSAKAAAPVQISLKDDPVASNRLNLEESKSISDIAYKGKQGEVYKFADGSTWRVERAESDHISGFKAVEMRKVVPDGTGGYKDDPNDNRLVAGFAGTDSPVDGYEDVKQALGATPLQYDEAVAFTKKVQQDAAANCETVNLTGHSLGGGLATYASIQTGALATAINSAPLSNGKVPDGVNYDGQITQYYAKGEMLTDLDNANPFDKRPGKHVEVKGAIDEDATVNAFYNSLPWYEKPFSSLETGALSAAISGTNHLLANTAPEIAEPTLVTQ